VAEAAGSGAARAQGLRRAGRNEEAATAYRRYLKRTPGDADAWRGLGLCYIALQQLEDAAYCFWQALKYRPASLRLMMQLGDILVQTGDMERAATVFEHVIKKHPGDARGFLSLSAVQRELGRVKLAGATLRNGVAKSPISVLSSLRAPEARILRLRGVQNAYYSVAPEAAHWLRLRGGNFSSSALWDQDRFTTINFLIADENILNFDRIPSHQIVVNSIADADLEGRSLAAAAKYLAGNPAVPVINDPVQVLNSNRTTVMAATPWMQELEQAYLDDPAAFVGDTAYGALKSLHGIAKLDFFGVDFNVLDDGRILIFEMNPAMRHSFEHAQNFPYLMPHAQRITDAFQAMITSRALPMKAEKPKTASSADGAIRISIKRAAR
jgi:hypothetical protein